MPEKINQSKSFNEQTNEFAYPIFIWQHKKPAKRNAFLFFRDEDAEEYHLFLLGNKRAKYPVATAIEGLTKAMQDNPDLFGWIRAGVRYVEREQKEQSQKDNSHGKGDIQV